MRPLTLLRAKPALPVMNRPLVHWILEQLRASGLRDVIVNLHHLPQTVRRSVGDGSAFGLRVQYSYERRILGTGGGPRKVRVLLGREPLLIVNGDVLFDFDLRRLIERHRKTGAMATLALLPNPDPRRYRPVVTAPSGKVRSLAGLPRPARGRTSLFTGVHVVEARALDRLPEGASDIVPQLYAPLVAEGQRLEGVRVRGAWYDLGSPSLYLASHYALLKAGFGGAVRGTLLHRRASVHEGARVTASAVGHASVVAAGARVRRSVLWDRVVIGEGAVVRDCILTSGARVAAGEKLEGVMVIPEGAAQGPGLGRARSGRHLVEIGY